MNRWAIVGRPKTLKCHPTGCMNPMRDSGIVQVLDELGLAALGCPQH
jgi:hypothetical protein